VFHGELEIRRLARIAAGDRNAVSTDLFGWLQSREAKRASEFFYWLGKYDQTSNWVETINVAGESESGELAFACYYGGRGSINAEAIEQTLDDLARRGRIRAEALVGATRFLPGSARAIARIITLLPMVDPARVQRQLTSGGWMNPLNSENAAILLRAIAGPHLENGALIIDFLAMWVQSGKPVEGDLAELAWLVLESAPQIGEAWDFDILAAALAPVDLDRAFRLLERYLNLPHDIKSWEPLDRHSGNRFWGVLWTRDRRRCFELLLTAGAASPLAQWRMSWHLPEMISLEDVEDRDLLLDFANQGERNAVFVSSFLTAAKPGFWPVAIDLLTAFPGNELIKRNLASAAEHMGQVIVGNSSDHHDRCATAVEQVLTQGGVPEPVRIFLSDLAQRLRNEAEAERHEEADESVNW
jgi:hypothetical protein